MSCIHCNVINCSHNDSGLCYANQISINGKKSLTSTHTYCSSFLDELNHNNLTNNTNDDNLCSVILCNVRTCSHNKGNLCLLNNISIASENLKANLYSETYCSSFNGISF